MSVLVLSTVGVAVMGEMLVRSVEHAAMTLGMSSVFVGVVVVAIVGNAAEHSSAVMMAMKNKMDLSFTIAVGSGIQISLFVAPLLVLASILMGNAVPLDLHFTPMEIVAVTISIMVLAQVAQDGETHWLEGVMLLAVYAILALAFYHLGEMNVPPAAGLGRAAACGQSSRAESFVLLGRHRGPAAGTPLQTACRAGRIGNKLGYPPTPNLFLSMVATKRPPANEAPTKDAPQKSGSQGVLRSYLRQSSRPLVSLAFVLPLLVMYEAGVLLLGPQAVRNGADVWLRQFLDIAGFGQYFLLPALTVGLLLAWHHLTRDRWQVSAAVVYVMFVECALLGLGLVGIGRMQGAAAQWLAENGYGVQSAAATVSLAYQAAPLAGRLVGFLGAGVYEEMLFRLLLLPPVAAIAWRLGASADCDWLER